MALSNPNSVVTEQRLSDFYKGILPYLGGVADAGFTPVGSVIAIMGVTAPANYLACNGQIVNVADYPELANYFEQQFGTKYKFGGSGTTFGIPDLQGEFLRGTGTNSHANQGSGADVGVHQDGTKHSWVNSNFNSNELGVRGDVQSGQSDFAPINSDSASSKGDGSTVNVGRISVTKASATSSQVTTFTSRPTNTSVLWCIATKNIYLNPSNDYSTDEKVVGTWIDGKTLYQKTIVDTMADTVNTFKAIDIGADVDYAQMVSGTLVNGATIANFNGVSSDLAGCFICTVNTNANKISLLTSIAGYVSKPCYITLQYTKA